MVYEVAVRGADLVITFGSVVGTLAPSGDRDAFSTSDTRIEFNRNAAGHVNALRLSTSRANNIRFERVD